MGGWSQHQQEESQWVRRWERPGRERLCGWVLIEQLPFVPEESGLGPPCPSSWLADQSPDICSKANSKGRHESFAELRKSPIPLIYAMWTMPFCSSTCGGCCPSPPPGPWFPHSGFHQPRATGLRLSHEETTSELQCRVVGCVQSFQKRPPRSMCGGQ